MPEEIKAVPSDSPGLGLEGFLSRTASGESSPVEKSSPADKPLDDKPAEEKPSGSGLDVKPGVADDKVDKPVKESVKSGKPGDKVESKPSETPTVTPAVNWDDENNPWKKKHDETDKRFKDTQRSWQEQHQQNLETQRQMQIMQKKFDGTYDPRVDEPPPPDPAAIRHWGAIEGKAEASFAAASRVHGTDVVMAALEKYATIFENDRAVQERILQSNDPVQGAMDAIAGYEFFHKYGPNPADIENTIRKQLEIELTPKIIEREAKRIQQELAHNKGEPKGLGRVQGSSGATDKNIGKDNAGRARPLRELFGS